MPSLGCDFCWVKLSNGDANMISDHEFTVELGRILRHRREMLYLSQEELAQASGFARSYISDVERGERNISIRNLYRLCQTLDIPAFVVLKQVEIAFAKKKSSQRKRARRDDTIAG